MKKELLGELPEFKERIEGNFRLEALIKDEIENADMEFDFDDSVKNRLRRIVEKILDSAEFEIESGSTVAIGNKSELSKSIVEDIIDDLIDESPTIENSLEISHQLMLVFTDFIKENC